MSGISILIPARNEAKTIRRTLQSIAGQSPAGLLHEVIVCDNGSCDGTAEQVAQLAELDPHLRLIEEPRAGKTHAWNRLFRSARFDKAVFMDADVILSPGVIPRLYAALTANPELIVVGAKSEAYRKSLQPWQRVVAAITQPNRYQSWIVGRMYALKRSAFARRMEQLTIDEMPEILAAEDTWVSLVAGRGHWRIEQDAVIYHMPYSLREFVRIERRHLMSLELLRQRCPQLVEQERQSRHSRKLVREKLEEIVRTKGLLAKTCTAVRLPLVAAIRGRIQRQLQNGLSPAFKWEVSEASKNLPEHVR